MKQTKTARRAGRKRRRPPAPVESTDGAVPAPVARGAAESVTMGYVIRQPLSSLCSPFHFLLYSVFQQLVVDIISLREAWVGETINKPSETRIRRRYDEIQNYLLSEDTHAFGFSFLCHHLGLDDRHVRTRLCRLLDLAFAGTRVRHGLTRTVIVQERRRKRI